MIGTTDAVEPLHRLPGRIGTEMRVQRFLLQHLEVYERLGPLEMTAVPSGEGYFVLETPVQRLNVESSREMAGM